MRDTGTERGGRRVDAMRWDGMGGGPLPLLAETRRQSYRQSNFTGAGRRGEAGLSEAGAGRKARRSPPAGGSQLRAVSPGPRGLGSAVLPLPPARPGSHHPAAPAGRRCKSSRAHPLFSPL